MQQNLREALENIPDAYSDFTESVYKDLRDSDENIQKLLDFIKDNPDAQTDDVLEYVDDVLLAS